jgi:hypothetical protein
MELNSIVIYVLVAMRIGLSSRCLKMNVYSDFIIKAFGRHVTHPSNIREQLLDARCLSKLAVLHSSGVSSRLPTGSASVQSHIMSCRVFGGQWSTVHVFLEYFDFPCQFLFPQMLRTHLSSGAGSIDELMIDVPSEFSLTPRHGTKKIVIVVK